MSQQHHYNNSAELLFNQPNNPAEGIEVERLHSQLLKINGQGLTLFVHGEVDKLDKIAAAVRDNGYFAMPAGTKTKMQDGDFLKVGSLLISSDPRTIDRMMDEGTKFRLPRKFETNADQEPLVPPASNVIHEGDLQRMAGNRSARLDDQHLKANESRHVEGWEPPVI